MAHLNRNEKLIRAAAKGEDAFGAKVFVRMMEFYRDVKFLNNDNNYDIIGYLYLKNHQRETFDCIAQKLGLSLSKLEHKRKEYQKMFLYFSEKLQAEIAA